MVLSRSKMMAFFICAVVFIKLHNYPITFINPVFPLTCHVPNFTLSCVNTLFPMLQYGTYLRFYSPDDAQFLIEILHPRNIPYKLEHEVNQLDKVYIGESIDPMFALQIPTAHFNVVNDLLAE